MSLKFLILLSVIGLSVGEVVDFKACAGVDSCTIQQTRITPCPEAESHAVCRIHRRKPATISFDFTTNFDADTLEGNLAWVKSETEELPLISMDREACKYTPCPVKAGQQQTYSMEVPIDKKFPVGFYTVKTTLKAPSGNQCCFTVDIKIVR